MKLFGILLLSAVFGQDLVEGYGSNRLGEVCGGGAKDEMMPPSFVEIAGCSGVLISSKHILFTAHCAKPNSTMDIPINTYDGSFVKKFGIGGTKTCVSDKYHFNAKERFYDIAIKRLEEEVWPSKPACLMNRSVRHSDKLLVVSNVGSNGNINLQVVSATLCKDQPAPSLPFICIQPNNSSDKFGNSESVAYVKKNKDWYVIGLSSFRTQEGSFFADIYYLRSDIDRTMKNCN